MCRSLVAATLMLGITIVPLAWTDSAYAAPNWQPQASEKLIKLPPSYLKKSLDSDFAHSDLGKALNETEKNIALKTNTLADLQSAVEQADGDVRTELRLQFLGEKRAYLELMSERNDLRRKHLQTQKKLYERMLRKIAENEAINGRPQQQELIQLQTAAQKRFESSLAKIDSKVFDSVSMTDSKYSQQYSKNRQAMDALLARINAHRMNQKAENEDGTPLTKKQHLRRLASDVETEISMIDQEDTILGYMAKLVALDAMALTEDGLDAELADADVATKASSDPVQSLDFFLDN